MNREKGFTPIPTTGLFPSLSSLQLVASDLDGTLLRSDKTISQQTSALFQHLRSVGITIVLVSARPPRVLRQIARDFHFSGLAICCNGAIIYDLDRDHSLQEYSLLSQQIEHLVTLLSASLPDLSFAVLSELRTRRGTFTQSGERPFQNERSVGILSAYWHLFGAQMGKVSSSHLTSFSVLTHPFGQIAASRPFSAAVRRGCFYRSVRGVGCWRTKS